MKRVVSASVVVMISLWIGCHDDVGKVSRFRHLFKAVGLATRNPCHFKELNIYKHIVLTICTCKPEREAPFYTS